MGKGLREVISSHTCSFYNYNFANISSFDAELLLVHYKSTYDNIFTAIAHNQTDSLAVVGILLREATAWDQWRAGKDPEAIDQLRTAAIKLSRPWRGPGAQTADLEIVLDQLLSGIT